MYSLYVLQLWNGLELQNVWISVFYSITVIVRFRGLYIVYGLMYYLYIFQLLHELKLYIYVVYGLKGVFAKNERGYRL